MSDVAVLEVNTDQDTADQAGALFSGFGLTLSDAINVFLHQAVRYQGFPFEIVSRVPNQQTLAAMAEARNLTADPGARSFRSMADLRADLLSDDDDD